ncbi:non-specific serine/threonine protein kinase [Ranunculus cassubicifolius]
MHPRLMPFLLFLLLIFTPYTNSIAVAESHLAIPNLTPSNDLNQFASPRRTLLAAADPVHEKQLVILQDGKSYLVDKSSGEVSWELQLSPKLSYLCGPGGCGNDNLLIGGDSAISFDDKYVVDAGDDIVNERKFMKIVADHFNGVKRVSKKKPILQIRETTLLVDFESGKVLEIFDRSSDNKNALVEINKEDLGKNALTVSNKEDVAEGSVLRIARRDYALLTFKGWTKTLLWNLTFSTFEAAIEDQEGKQHVPVVHIRDRSHVRFVDTISNIYHEDAIPFLTPGNFMPLIDDGSIGTYSTILTSKTGLSIAILCFFFISVLWYIGIIPISTKTSTNELKSGRNATISRRKKGRKSANNKNDVTVEKHILHGAVGRFKSDSLNEKENIEIPIDANASGRRIGKLFISNTEIAKGSNGTIVMEGIYDGRAVAVKRLVQAHHDVAYKEIQNLIASDRHPNIVRWYGVEHDSDFVYLSLERCTCSLGDLVLMSSDYLSNLTSAKGYNEELDTEKKTNMQVELWKTNGYPSPQLLRLMRDIVSGLVHLHDLGIIHRDLKPQNILIVNEKSLCAKLSDMGISKRLLGDKSSLGCHPTGYGSSGWQAPEQLLHGRQTRAVDMFGLGCVLFFCITGGKHPYGDPLERDINIVKNRVDLFMVEQIPEAVDLFSRLLDPNPELRPTASSVLVHPLFWSSETRLSFLRDVSDRVELEDRETNSDLLNALENIAPIALGGNWDEKMETKFIDNIGRYRRYKYNSIRDLLRVMRNKSNHYRELPKDIQELLGPVPDGFDSYFSSRFPKFLIEVYKVISSMCKEEECFKKYFKEV